MRSGRLEDFDLAALYAAADEQRQARGLTWAGATREINRPDARPVLHPISVSSVTGTRNGRGGEGNIALQILLWLDRTPESFVPDQPAPSTSLMDASGTSNRTPRTPGQFRRLLAAAPRTDS